MPITKTTDKETTMKKCGRCGICCRNFSIPKIGLHQVNDVLQEFPFLMHKISDIRKNGRGWVPFFNCSYLKEENGYFICRNYRHRPWFCRNFPMEGQHRPKTCTL